SRLLIAHLPETHHGTPQELAHCAGADPESAADLGISQSFHAKKQAPFLLFAEPLHGMMKAHHALPFEEFALRRRDAGRILRPHVRIERLLRLLPRANLQAEVVRYAKDPGARALNLLALAQRGIKPQKDFLHGLLRTRRIQPEGQQVSIYIVARLF